MRTGVPTMRGRVILCGLLMSTFGTFAGASGKLSMAASPEISYAPAHLIVRTTIEPNDQNRFIQIEIDSNDYYRSSRIELNGAESPRTSIIEFRSVPGGEYMISARLLDEAGAP